MGQLQKQIQQSSRSRDDELRRAHQRAFEEIRRASDSADERAGVTLAVQHLIEACEAYVWGEPASVRGAA